METIARPYYIERLVTRNDDGGIVHLHLRRFLTAGLG